MNLKELSSTAAIESILRTEVAIYKRSGNHLSSGYARGALGEILLTKGDTSQAQIQQMRAMYSFKKYILDGAHDMNKGLSKSGSLKNLFYAANEGAKYSRILDDPLLTSQFCVAAKHISDMINAMNKEAAYLKAESAVHRSQRTSKQV